MPLLSHSLFLISYSLFSLLSQKSPNISPLYLSFAPMKKVLLLCFFILSLINLGKAQMVDRTAIWVGSINNFHINKHWSVQFDFHLRSADKWENLQTMILRPGISYRFNPKWNVVLGYNHLENRAVIGSVSGYIPENQLWQQIWFRHPFKKANIIHRISFEQRFIQYAYAENNKIKHREAVFTQRFRYLLRTQIPLVNAKPAFKKGPYIIAQDELLLNFHHKENANGQIFDQNRIFAGLGYRFSPKLDIEAGYQNRHIVARGGARYIDHISQITTFLRL